MVAWVLITTPDECVSLPPTYTAIRRESLLSHLPPKLTLHQSPREREREREKKCSIKIEVFISALHTQFGPSQYIYTSLNVALQNATPIWKMKPSLEVLNTIYPPQEPMSVGHYIVTTRRGVRWLILSSSHCTGNMYHVIHVQV